MTAFGMAVDVLFLDPNLGRDVVFTPDGGTPITVRAVIRRPDRVLEFGDSRIHTDTTTIDIRVSEVAGPRPGDGVEIDGEAFVIQGEPVRKSERLIWTLDLRPV